MKSTSDMEVAKTRHMEYTLKLTLPELRSVYHAFEKYLDDLRDAEIDQTYDSGKRAIVAQQILLEAILEDILSIIGEEV